MNKQTNTAHNNPIVCITPFTPSAITPHASSTLIPLHLSPTGAQPFYGRAPTKIATPKWGFPLRKSKMSFPIFLSIVRTSQMPAISENGILQCGARGGGGGIYPLPSMHGEHSISLCRRHFKAPTHLLPLFKRKGWKNVVVFVI